jgi:membrane protease subunit (stomatin/prohibitin family)
LAHLWPTPAAESGRLTERQAARSLANAAQNCHFCAQRGGGVGWGGPNGGDFRNAYQADRLSSGFQARAARRTQPFPGFDLQRAQIKTVCGHIAVAFSGHHAAARLADVVWACLVLT